MSEQQSTAGSGENVGIPRPTRFVAVIQRAIDSYPKHGGPGIQLAAWVANAIIAYLNAPAGQPDPSESGGSGEHGGAVGAVRLTNLAEAVQRGLDHPTQPIGPTQANYVADAVIDWLQNTY